MFRLHCFMGQYLPISISAAIAIANTQELSSCTAFNGHSCRARSLHQFSLETGHVSLQKPEKIYKYVIVGAGVSSSAALQEILSQTSPGKASEDILVIIDPANGLGDRDALRCLRGGNRINVVQGKLSKIDLSAKVIHVDKKVVGYKACLFSSGLSSMSNEPGKNLVDESCQQDIVDTKSFGGIAELMDAVSRGKHVTLIGGDNWNVLAIAGKLTQLSRNHGYVGTVTMVLPASGPLSSHVPRYLSHSIGKRLALQGVELLTFSQVRYIGGEKTFLPPSSILSTDELPQLGVFISKVFDTLNTSVLYTDKVGFATTTPTPINGALRRSTAPANFHLSLSPTKELSSSSSPPPRDLLEILSSAGLELCPSGTGIVVNRNLQAIDGVYVAGELANLYMGPTLGRGQFPGTDHAYHTGTVAGRNMAGVFDTYSHIPVYEVSSSELGIHLAFVGHCSAAFESHGFWWKITGPSEKSTSLPPSSSSLHHLTADARSSEDDMLSGRKDNIADADTVSRAHYLPSSLSAWKWLTGSKFTDTTIDTTKSSSSSFSSSHLPKGKLALRRVTPEPLPPRPLPPLSLGVVFYCDRDIITGVLVSGVPPVQKRTCDLGEEDCKMNYSEIIHERARQWIGRSLNELSLSSPTSADVLQVKHSGGNSAGAQLSSSLSAGLSTSEALSLTEFKAPAVSGVNDHRSQRLIRLQQLADIATFVMLPAVAPVDDVNHGFVTSDTRQSNSGSSSGGGGGVDSDKAGTRARTGTASLLPRPVHKYCPPSKTALRQATASSLVRTNSYDSTEARIAPGFVSENVILTGDEMTGSRSDRIAAAYAAGIKYGIQSNNAAVDGS